MSAQSQYIEQHLGEDECVLMEAGMWQSKRQWGISCI